MLPSLFDSDAIVASFPYSSSACAISTHCSAPRLFVSPRLRATSFDSEASDLHPRSYCFARRDSSLQPLSRILGQQLRRQHFTHAIGNACRPRLRREHERRIRQSDAFAFLKECEGERERGAADSRDADSHGDRARPGDFRQVVDRLSRNQDSMAVLTLELEFLRQRTVERDAAFLIKLRDAHVVQVPLRIDVCEACNCVE